jgi:hypothetical protein
MNAATATELLRLSSEHPDHKRAALSVAGWLRVGPSVFGGGPVLYAPAMGVKGLPLAEAHAAVMVEARRITSPECHAESVGQGVGGRKPSPRSLTGSRESALTAQREKATRDFLGDALPTLDDGEMIDLADDAEEAMPPTVAVKGLRAAEEA